MMVRGSLLFALLASYMGFAQQGGGMWIPTELNEKEMKEMGLQISAQDIFSTSDKSINNAVAHFGGGCTSEVISPNGLLLTNHHCGYGQIQSHSSLEHDYLTDGFWVFCRYYRGFMALVYFVPQCDLFIVSCEIFFCAAKEIVLLCERVYFVGRKSLIRHVCDK